jgi:membrane associated rhomboid family serine protease
MEQEAWWGRVRRAPVTVGLVVACWSVFVALLGVCAGGAEVGADVWRESPWSLGACGESLRSFGALELARVWVDEEWWRVGLTGLLHGSWLHLILNTWSVWAVGTWAEQAWGSVRLLAIFVLSSVAGCLASLAWAEAAMVVGASAGVMGIAGALLVGRLAGDKRLREQLEPISARALGLMLAALVTVGFFVPLIAQAGHLGGLAMGVMLGWVWRGGSRAWERGLGWTLVLASLGALVGLGRDPDGRDRYSELVAFRQLELGNDGEAMRMFEQALAARPGDPVLANAVAYGLAEAGRELGRAKDLVRGALEVEPENPDYLDTLGWIQCRQGDVDDGKATLERADALSDGAVAEIRQHLDACESAAVPSST